MSGANPRRGRPTADQSALIADRILDAAWQVLMEAGPEQLSVDRIAHVAHASKQTIYARYSGKLDLLQAVLKGRTGVLFSEVRESPVAADAESAFTDLAWRAVRSLSHPEARMLERLVDWIDAALTGGADWPSRRAVYKEIQDLICAHLLQAAERWGLVIDDYSSAAAFWLDGLIGHVRGLPRDSAEQAEWAAKYARFFLRAIGFAPPHR